MDPRPSHATAPPPTEDTSAGPRTLAGGVVPLAADSADAFLAPPQRPDEIGRLGPYRVLGVLGRGGMGVVYRAEDPRLRRLVALKVMLPRVAADPRAKARFRREAQAQAKVEHDHIIPIHEVEEAGGVAYIAMPLLKGQTLGEALRQNPRPPLAEAVRVGREAAEGLAAAHEAGLVHRDIKPGNVWLEGARRRVRILDFGLARAPATGEDGDEPRTAVGAVLGTPSYMSPEQAQGGAVDHRTDLFGLGVVLYQMTTGRMPFTGPNPLAVLIAVAQDEPPPAHAVAPELPPALGDLIRRLLAKDPAARPQTAGAVAEELAAIERGLAVLPVQVIPLPSLLGAPAGPDPWADIDTTHADDAVRPTPARPRTRSGSPKWLWPAVAGFGLAAVAAVLAALQPWESNPETEAVQEPNPAPVTPKPKSSDRAAAEAPNPRLASGREATVKKGGMTEPEALDREVAVLFNPHAQLGLDLRSGRRVYVEPGKPLPEEPFAVGRISISGGVQLDREAFIPAAGRLRSLKGLADWGGARRIRAEDLARLAGLPAAATLEEVVVNYLDLTPELLATLKRFPRLEQLHLSGVSADDAVLERLAAELPKLRALGLRNLAPLKGDGRGAAAVARLPLVSLRLEFVDPATTWTLDRNWCRLISAMPELVEFRAGARVRDEDLAELARSRTLTELHIWHPEITDAGLERLAGLKTLYQLSLRRTKVTAGGVEKLAEALPGCKIEWDGGTVEPRPPKK